MKESKAVYATKHDIRDSLHYRKYHLYENRVIAIEREYIQDRKYDTSKTQDIGIQYDNKRNNLMCTCHMNGKKREVKYFSIPKQVYRYIGSRSFTDVGVGSVKALQKRKVKKIYLPETDDRGVGSSDLSAFLNRKIRYPRGSYYDHKRTSSKCVGGELECGTTRVLSERTSPIVHTRSGVTSPKSEHSNHRKNIDIGNNTIEKKLNTTITQVEVEDVKREELVAVAIVESVKAERKKVLNIENKKFVEQPVPPVIETTKSIPDKKDKELKKDFSSDSLVQHVHNLENPSKQSRNSEDLIENKLEREYRKMFLTKSKEQKQSQEKPMPDFKSTSLLRRRFEALRRGLAKKEDSKKNAVIIAKTSSQTSEPSHRDVSIASDPPSLEGRSFSNTKPFSPVQSNLNQRSMSNPRTAYDRAFGHRKRESVQWSRPSEEDVDLGQDVKGMFKLWGKKFNLEEENYKKKPIPNLSYDTKKAEKKKEPDPPKAPPKNEAMGRKEGRKFFFFKRKGKDKSKPYKPKKDVTAGRCEVRDGLMIRVGTGNAYPLTELNTRDSKNTERLGEMLKKAWLRKYLSNAIESRDSVKIRWHNKMYATSSSTIFELIDSVYKNSGVVFRSKSDVMTYDCSNYRQYTRPRVNFVQQDIETWMIPKMVPNKPIEMPVKINSNPEKGDKRNNIEVRISDQKWFIDKSKAFSHKIEVVLHSKNFVKLNRETSSEYLQIDIPKGYFSDSSSEENQPKYQSSDEEVYKIVEYETPKSSINVKKKYDTGDHLPNDIKVTGSVRDRKAFEPKILETVIKRPPVHRDVVVQGSNVYVPKRCDVIGVGIITQRDVRDIRKPILKIQDIDSDDSDRSLHNSLKKCEFAESYLQDYYRNFTPLGIDLYSWCVSDSHLQCCSENDSCLSPNNQGDSKSCPNIYDDYNTSTIISSCETSSCSHCAPLREEEKKQADSFTSKLFKKFTKTSKSETKDDSVKRVLPKDSVEVFKRRKIYAASNKSKWFCSDDRPYSVPSIQDKGAQNTQLECPKLKKPCFKTVETKPKKKVCKKHVSMPDCEAMNKSLAEQLKDILPEGILTFKGAAGCNLCKKKGETCPKHAKVKPVPCEIPSLPESPALSPPSTPSTPSSPTSSGAKLDKSPSPTPSKKPSPPNKKTSPCHKITPPPTKKPLSPCRKPSPPKKPLLPCKKPSPPCNKPSPPCNKPSPPYKENSPPSKEPLQPCKRSFPPCKKSSPPSPCKERSPALSPVQSGVKLYKQPSPPCKKPSPCSKKPSPLCRKPSPPPCKKPTPSSCKRSSPIQINVKCLSPPSCSPPPRTPLPCSPPPRPPPPCLPLPRPPPPCSPPPRPASPHPPPCCPTSPSSSSPSSSSSPPSSLLNKRPLQPCSHPTPPPCCHPIPPSCCHPSPPRSPPPSSPPLSPGPSNSPPCSPNCKSPKKVKKKEKKPCKTVSPKISVPICKKCLTPLSESPPCQFPWPTKNQVSNQPSLESFDTPSPSQTPKKCKKKAPIKSVSCESVVPKKKEECKQTCPNKPKSPSPKPCPPPPPPTLCPPPPTCPASSSPPLVCPPPLAALKESIKQATKQKLTGLFLRKNASKKKVCPQECLDPCSKNEKEQNVIRLNSQEQISIRIKKETPSTTEIREGMNIKVLDEDGQTLYERKDYKKQDQCVHKPSVLGDMYKNSNVNRVSTPIIVKNMKSEQNCHAKSKSDTSIANQIEIHFKLRVTQGDKTTEINIGNDGDSVKEKDKKYDICNTTPQDVYIMRNKTEDSVEDVNPKNDVNIRIMIKNYKTKSAKKRPKEKTDEEFSTKISEKFHSVSTGYSDVEAQENVPDASKVYSVHRATVDLTSSFDKSKTQSKPSEELVSAEQTDHEHHLNFTTSSRSATEHSETEQSLNKAKGENMTEAISVSSNKESENKNIDEKYTEKTEPRNSVIDTDDQDAGLKLDKVTSEKMYETKSKEETTKPRTNEEKKEMLKKVLEKASDIKKNNKERMKKLRDMLKAILTSDSSEPDEVAMTSNELVKDITYASLKPNYFRDTDSMTNYYKMDSTIMSTGSPQVLYPTKEDNSNSESEVAEEKNVPLNQRCLCNTLATRLNIKTTDGDIDGCCCKRLKNKKNEETNCDLRTEDDYLLLNYNMTEFLDVETQHSKCMSSSYNSVDISLQESATVRDFPNDLLAQLEPLNIYTDGKETEENKKSVKKTFSPHANHIKECEMKKLNRETILGISNEDKIILLNSESIKTPVEKKLEKEKKNDEKKKLKKDKPARFAQAADILQCYETKKAVLEIYAERIASDDGEHLVAKLPKFVYGQESEIKRKYEEDDENGYRSFCKRNFVMMSIKR